MRKAADYRCFFNFFFVDYFFQILGGLGVNHPNKGFGNLDGLRLDPLQVKKRFLEQYNGAKNLIIPPGYNFHSKPNLMQRYTAYLVSTRKRLGNWSGTGAGKTLSAILSSRVINSRVTVICCPNNVISGWKKAIKDTYPDSYIFEKTLNISFENENIKPIYLILNYEFFQKPRSESYLKKFINKHKIDFVVIDEIHYSKQRTSENLSKRKKVIAALLSEATQINPYLHILGMSATPVINNLFEGKDRASFLL